MDDHVNFELNVNQGEENEKFLVIKAAIDKGRADAQKSVNEQTVMAATNLGDLEKIKQLITINADVNTLYPHINSFTDGHTPLLVAVRDGHTEIVKQLLTSGAKIRV